MLYRPRPTKPSKAYPRDGIWFAEPRPIRRTSGRISNWCFAPVFLFFAALAFGQFSEWLLGFALGSALTRLVAEIVWRVGEAVALRAMQSDRAFSDAPPGIVEYPTEIVLYNAGRNVGADRGFVWFDDGLLRFNGSACSFALSASDFFPRGMRDGKDFYSDLPSDAFRLKTYGRAATVRFLPLGGRKRWGLHYRLGMFVGKDESTDAPRQWPPLEPFGEVSTIDAFKGYSEGR